LDIEKNEKNKINMEPQKKEMENEKVQDFNLEENKEELNEKTDPSFEAVEDDETAKKSGFFGKKDKKSKLAGADGLKQEIEKLKTDNAELQDKFLRLYSEFDNYRKRTQKEKTDIIQNAAEAVIISLLPVLDDMERAVKYSENPNANLNSIKEGELLIFQKLNNLLRQKGLKAIEMAENAAFDTDFHEAVATIPADNEENKGKVVEEIEKGYMLNEKVVRFSKVVIYQ
jgi:molecular chaperone GrpE